jgi:DNA primase
MGTSLTAGQASLLRRYTRRVVIAYDGDEAGRNATLRAAPILLSAGFEVSALDLQGEKDPDTLIQKQGVDRFYEVLGTPMDIFDFALTQWGGGIPELSGREKSERIEGFMPLLSAVSDPVMRNDAAQRIADAFRLEFETVWSKVRGRAQQATADRQVSAPVPTGQKMVLTAALQGKLPEAAAGWLTEEFFEDSACKTLFSIIKNEVRDANPIDFAHVQTHVKGEAELTLLSELTLTDAFDFTRIDENLREMQKSHLERRKQQIQREIVEAEKAGDLERVDQLVGEKMELSRMSNPLK